jgi:hypothetical protein
VRTGQTPIFAATVYYLRCALGKNFVACVQDRRFGVLPSHDSLPIKYLPAKLTTFYHVLVHTVVFTNPCDVSATDLQ